MSEIKNRPWPNVPRILFDVGEPSRLNARVGAVMSNADSLVSYASAYRNAAERLYTLAKEASAEVYSVAKFENLIDIDGIVFPIAFLWRHHVEIMLKDIIVRGMRYEREYPTSAQEEDLKRHDLEKLWALARPHIESCGPPESPEVANVENNIHELAHIDPGSFSFRYPTNKRDGAPSLPSDITHINLRILNVGMQAVANLLEGVQSMMIDYETNADRDYAGGDYE